MRVCATSLKPWIEHHQPITLNVGDEHEFKIVKMTPEEKKVGLSLRAIGDDAARVEVEGYQQRERETGGGHKPNSGSSGGSSSSTTLGDLINWKRSERE